MNVQSLAKKVEAALKKLEEMNLRDNFFVLWKDEERPEIPPKSLVVILTKYPPEE